MNYLVQNKQNQSILMCTKQQFTIHNTIFTYSIRSLNNTWSFPNIISVTTDINELQVIQAGCFKPALGNWQNCQSMATNSLIIH